MISLCVVDMCVQIEAMPDALPKRRRPAHLPLKEALNQSAIVLVTACTNRRRSLFTQADVAALLSDVWQEADTWLVGRFVIMPDHLHLFCAPAHPDSPAPTTWMKYWKTLAS